MDKFGSDAHTDYSVDTIARFPMELKGNSAEGNVYEPAMQGYGRHATLTRVNIAFEGQEGINPPGAFVQGNNEFNNVAAGKPGSLNTKFTTEETED